LEERWGSSSEARRDERIRRTVVAESPHPRERKAPPREDTTRPWHRSDRRLKRHGIEVKMKDGQSVPVSFTNWTSLSWYRTKEQRNEALKTLEKKDRLFIYRAVER
jgi:hypothetical protein